MQASGRLACLATQSANFLVEGPRPILESVMASRTLPVEHGVVPLGGGAILSFILGRPRVILSAPVSFHGCPVSLAGQLSCTSYLHFGHTRYPL
jgi:hypothetical protein